MKAVEAGLDEPLENVSSVGQKEAIENIVFSKKERLIFNSPVGFGKSLIF